MGVQRDQQLRTVRADSDRVRQRRRVGERRVVYGLRLSASLCKIHWRRQWARDDGMVTLRSFGTAHVTVAQVKSTLPECSKKSAMNSMRQVLLEAAAA